MECMYDVCVVSDVCLCKVYAQWSVCGMCMVSGVSLG